MQLGNTVWRFCSHGIDVMVASCNTRVLFSHLVSVFVSHGCPQHVVSVAEHMKNTVARNITSMVKEPYISLSVLLLM